MVTKHEPSAVRDPSQASVASLLDQAARFLDRYSDAPGINDTFHYFTRHPVAPLNRARLESVASEIRRLRSNLHRPVRVLDLACGGGLISCLAASAIEDTNEEPNPPANPVVGFDLSEDEIRLAERFASEFGYSARFAVRNLVDEPEWEWEAERMLDGKPDCVILAYALHHLPEVENFVSRLGNWLPRRATLLINEENPLSPSFRLKHVVRSIVQKDTETEWHRSYAGWKRLLEGAGFQVGRPAGRELLPLLGGWMERTIPGACWSLVFTAERG